VQNGANIEGILLDLSEDGMDVLTAQPLYPSAPVSARFVLPNTDTEVEPRGEVAWANPNGQSGVRFVDLAENLRASLKTWVGANSPQLPPEDPEPVADCKLTDLSLGGCYVETESPFPERAGIVLCLKAGDIEVKADGTVRVMHPEFGMGIEFASRTAEQREAVGNFIDFLTSRPGTCPELLVTPRALTAREDHDHSKVPITYGTEDSLLSLLRNHESLTQEQFLEELRKQRTSEQLTSS
jgi:hypothetical protein